MNRATIAGTTRLASRMHPTPDTPAPGATSAATSSEPAPSSDTLEPDADAPQAAAAEPAATANPIPDLPPAACAARLAELFPAVFTPGHAQPLKLRIQADIQERAPGIFTRKALSTFLHRHTTSTAYLRALVSAPNRIDLGGQPAGEVAAEHREAATLELQRRRELFEARRAAERQAQSEAQRAAQRAAREQPGPVQAGPDEALAATAVQVDARRPPAARGEPRRDRAAQQGRRFPPRRDDVRREPAPPVAQAARSPQTPPAAAPAQTPQDPQRRDRQALLRAFEATTLTKRNFCALKGLSEAELDAQLAQARQDAAPAQPAREKSPQSQPRRSAVPERSANRS